jgi:hypothetical protein
MTSRQFTCALCEKVCEAEGTEAEAVAEYEARFGIEFRPEDVSLICDECDQMVIVTLRDDPEFRDEVEAELGPINLNATPAKVM